MKFNVAVAVVILSASVHVYASDDPVVVSENKPSEVEVDVNDAYLDTIKEDISSEELKINAIGGECQLMFPACDTVD